jgi:hypothetical protein
MDIIQKEVAALVPYANNTKGHPDDQVARIAASIREFGFNQPVLVDGAGVLVAGHGRVLTSDEAKLVLDVQNGAAALGGQPGIWIRGGLVLNVEDGIELNKYDEKWGIDGPELVRKLQRLGAGETAALLDWCRVMWERCEDEEYWAKELGRFKEVV